MSSLSSVSPPAVARVDRAAVLGLGLIGGSLLQVMRQTGIEVVGYDTDPDAVDAASSAGYPVAPSDAAAVHGADLVVLAMPLPQVRNALRSVAPHLSPGTLLTDVGTLKSPVAAAVREFVPHATFVGGHPLAGVEDTGWAAADPMLFRDCPWALVLDENSLAENSLEENSLEEHSLEEHSLDEGGSDEHLSAWLRLAGLVCDIGAKPVPTTAAEQDAAVARVIGLPHVLAEALALTGLAGGPLGLTLAAGSYRSGSRVARTRPELVTSWCDGNRALTAALDDAIAHLSSARAALAADHSILPLAIAGHDARINWEHRRFVPVEPAPTAAGLLELGRQGGWLTALLRDEAGLRLLGMRPV